MYNTNRNILLVPIAMVPAQSANTGYLIGGIIAFLILSYLIYTIARPEKF